MSRREGCPIEARFADDPEEVPLVEAIPEEVAPRPIARRSSRRTIDVATNGGPLLVVSRTSWPGALLLGRKVDVIVTARISSMLELGRRIPPRAVLTTFGVEDGDALDLLAKSAELTPAPRTTVLLAEDEVSYAEACVEAGATHVVNVENGEEDVLSVLSSIPGVEYAPSERVEARLAARIEIAGQAWNVPTCDLRSTGLAVVGLPPLDHGVTAHVHLALPEGGAISGVGRVTRTWQQDVERCTAFYLSWLPNDARIRLGVAITHCQRCVARGEIVGQWRSDIESLFALEEEPEARSANG